MTKDEVAQIRAALSEAEEPMIREIVRQAESFLAAQLQAGLASDLRAMTMATILAAILSFLVGGTASLIAAEKVHLGWHLVTIAEMVAIFGYSLGCAIKASKPTGFDFAGSNPRFWVRDVAEKRKIVLSLAAQAAQYADGIACNSEVLAESQRWQKRALTGMAAAIVLALATEFIIALSMIAKHGVWKAF